MDWLSPYLVAIVIGWFLSHVVKYIIDAIKGRQANLKQQLFISGGMPSSHTATVMALWAVVLLKDGPVSGLFGVASLLAIIVAYDAAKVRRSVGEQGVALTSLLKEAKGKHPMPYVSRGHLPMEVLVGALFGVLVGIVVFFTTNG